MANPIDCDHPTDRIRQGDNAEPYCEACGSSLWDIEDDDQAPETDKRGEQ
jgi:hypothetical protein